VSGEPVSWLVIERGWKVEAADGSEVGRIEELVGDTGKDIFNGLSISTGLLARARYVPAEQVSSITDGHVKLDLSPQEVEALPEYRGAPPSTELRAD